ncbi:MAG: helix-turn-helix transcriptional regulator [Clostridia bacterium]|nr:helix-turn-helix transcriptional regulator [Clostridia bacterium]
MTKSLFKRVICSYLIISLIPVLIMLTGYRSMETEARIQAEELTQSLLDRASDSMSAALNNVDILMSALSVDDRIMHMVSSAPIDRDNASYLRMFDAEQALSHAQFSYESLLDTVLYCEKSGIVITATHIFLSLDRFYDVFFRFGDMDLGAWNQVVLQDASPINFFPMQTVFMRTGAGEFDTVTRSAILISRSVRSGAGKGKMIACVSVEALAGLLDPISSAYHGGVALYNPSGEQMAVVGSIGEAAMEAMDEGRSSIPGMIMLDNVSDNGWRFVALLNEAEVFAAPNAMKRAVIFVVLAELVVLVALAVVFTRRSVKPVEQLIGLVSGVPNIKPQARDGFDYLHEAIAQINQGYAQTSWQLDEQSKILKRSLLASLLRGEQSEELLQDSFERAGLACPEPTAPVAALCWNGFTPNSRNDMARVMVGEWLARMEQEGRLLFAGMDEETAALVFLGSVDRPAVEKMLESLYASLAEVDCPLPAVSVFSAVDGRSFSQRYRAAEIRVHRWDAEAGSIDWVDGGTKILSRSVRYPISVEERIIRAVKMGACGELDALLLRLREANADLAGMSGDAKKSLTAAFRMTCARIQEEAQFLLPEGEKDRVNIHPDIAISAGASLDDFCAYCSQAAEQIDQQRRKAGRSETIAAVCAYLAENYSDKQLCLSAVADHFGFSETYFSRLFKAQMGMAYSEYLERLRIERACQLLLEGASVDRTADQTGYNSVTVFRAAFKRICGVTPTEYRRGADHAETGA